MRPMFLAALALSPLALAEPTDALIHPGVLITFPLRCTVAFVHEHAGETYFSTAGHCVRNGSRVKVAAASGESVTVGSVVRLRDAGPGDDWALVRVDEAYWTRVGHGVPGFGEPTPGPAAKDGLYGYVGWGLATPGMPRVGAAAGEEPHHIRFVGLATMGDSGAPVLALGVNGSRVPVGILGHAVVDGGSGLIHATPLERLSFN